MGKDTYIKREAGPLSRTQCAMRSVTETEMIAKWERCCLGDSSSPFRGKGNRKRK